jgi:hypothetical protein
MILRFSSILMVLFLTGCNISFCISPSMFKTDTNIEEDSLEKVAVIE